MNQIAQRQRGFTLIELLVVISIILLLATFGLSKLLGAQRDAELATSKDRLGQIHAHITRYENAKRRLPTASGSEFVLSIWGGRFLEKSVNNAQIFFDASLAAPELTEETLEEDVMADTIHWAGRNQSVKRFRVGRINSEGSSKKIVACNKPLVDGEMPHQGDYLAVVYLNGATRAIGRDEYPDDWGEDDILEIGENSPIKALEALAGSPEDDEGSY